MGARAAERAADFSLPRHVHELLQLYRQAGA
jgi:hypothetical protein